MIDIYNPLHPAAFFMIQRRQRLFRKIFAEHFPEGVQNLKLLEIGCGNGQWLTEFQMFRFDEKNMAGIELDEERANQANTRVPQADVRHGDASNLPWNDDEFDIVFQSTVFTSILNEELRSKVASEMRRVCKKNGKGIILWYDFTFDNPKNPDVKGIKETGVRQLFPNCSFQFQTVTLAPPIARRLAPLSWTMAELLETFAPFLRTHLTAVIQPG